MSDTVHRKACGFFDSGEIIKQMTDIQNILASLDSRVAALEENN